ncbi:MAG: hypothetical protein Q9225_005235 [Loekoesia sp. 1 TL-2023]
MDRFTSICQRLCNLPCCNRRESEDSNTRTPEQEQENALKKIMEKEYPISDPAAERRKFHKQIPQNMNEPTHESLTRLIVFTNTVPGHWEKRRESRGLFRIGREEYLTDLARYWRDLPSNDEMMKYKDIWEHVARRPLAWEGLVE